MKENTDSRSIPRYILDERRRVARKMSKKGLSPSEISDIVNAHPQTVRQWLKLKEHQVKTRQGGTKPGDNRLLSPDEEQLIQELIQCHSPDELGLPCCLWTRRAIGELIKQKTGQKVAIRTIGHYLKRWGFTPQKPTKRAYEQNPKAVQRWLEVDFPQITEKAKSEGGEIYWGDETGLRSDCQHGRGYQPRGKTPIIKLNSKRFSINMISAISNQGTLRFSIFEGTMTANILIDFCKRLIATAERKVFLILDNLRVHHAKVFKAWLEEHEDIIEVFYLPSYSPELNPDEYLNCDLKAGVHSLKPARSKKDLKHKTLSHMRKLQKSPDRIKKYFHHECIRYAA